MTPKKPDYPALAKVIPRVRSYMGVTARLEGLHARAVWLEDQLKEARERLKHALVFETEQERALVKILLKRHMRANTEAGVESDVSAGLYARIR